MFNDRTSAIESVVSAERKPTLRHLLSLFSFAFSSAKGISAVYLGVYICMSLLRPVMALLWGRYIQTAQELTVESTIIPAVLLLAAYFVINFIVSLIERYVTPREDIERLDKVQANRHRELIHTKLFEKLASLPAEYLEIPKINDNVEQVFNFAGAEWQGLSMEVMMKSYAVIAKVVSVLSIAASLYIFNPWLCLLVLLAPLPALWSLTLGQKLKFKFIKENTKLQRKAEYFQNMMISPAGKELKALGLNDFFFGKWKEIADEYTIKEKRLIRSQALLQLINNTIARSAIIGGNAFAIVLMATGRLTLGALGAVMSLVSALVGDFESLLSNASSVISKKNEAAQFADLMELPSEGDVGQACDEIDAIEATGLKYRYPLTERYVLNGVNLTIRKGEKVAFVGENGMGKTTFVKLITGTLSASEGELMINGIAAESINSASRYGALSAVVQDAGRYVSFTVGDNVYLGDTLRPRDEAAVDGALAFSGFSGAEKDALLGKDIGGTELSGGQWQKLAIARAAYRGRDFIILDEPTSNLDPLAETEIFKKYIELSADKTVIFVTHRISIASLADRIVVFANGVIAQDGTHDELIVSEGEYARLYNEQAKWYDR